MICNIIGIMAILGFMACQVAFVQHPVDKCAQWSIASGIYLLIAAICFK